MVFCDVCNNTQLRSVVDKTAVALIRLYDHYVGAAYANVSQVGTARVILDCSPHYYGWVETGPVQYPADHTSHSGLSVGAGYGNTLKEIGRASCRERV